MLLLFASCYYMGRREINLACVFCFLGSKSCMLATAVNELFLRFCERLFRLSLLFARYRLSRLRMVF